MCDTGLFSFIYKCWCACIRVYVHCHSILKFSFPILFLQTISWWFLLLVIPFLLNESFSSLLLLPFHYLTTLALFQQLQSCSKRLLKTWRRSSFYKLPVPLRPASSIINLNVQHPGLALWPVFLNFIQVFDWHKIDFVTVAKFPLRIFSAMYFGNMYVSHRCRIHILGRTDLTKET